MKKVNRLLYLLIFYIVLFFIVMTAKAFEVNGIWDKESDPGVWVVEVEKNGRIAVFEVDKQEYSELDLLIEHLSDEIKKALE